MYGDIALVVQMTGSETGVEGTGTRGTKLGNAEDHSIQEELSYPEYQY